MKGLEGKKELGLLGGKELEHSRAGWVGLWIVMEPPTETTSARLREMGM